MSIIIYDPIAKEVRHENERIAFFCGKELDGISSAVLSLNFGKSTAQEAHTEIKNIFTEALKERVKDLSEED